MKPTVVLFACAAVGIARADPPKFDPFAYPHAYPTYQGLGSASIAASEVAKYAPPPLDPAVSHHIQAMLDVRGVDGGQLTAAGDRMFFTWRITGTAQVWRQDGPNRFAVQLTGGEDNTAVAGLAPDDSFVVVSRDIGGEENPGLYLLSPTGGPLRAVQHAAHVKTELQFIADDSKALYYRANDRDPASYAIYRFDVASGARELVFGEPGLWRIADHQGGEWLLVKDLGNAQDEVYRYDVATKRLTPLLGQNEVEDYDVRFGARPGQVLVRTNKLGEFRRLYAFDGAKLAPITPAISHDVSSVAIDRARLRIYYTVDEDGYTRLQALDARTQQPIALPALPADNATASGATRTGRYVQLTYDSATVPATTVVFDWQTRKLAAWRTPATPEIDPRGFARDTLESYPARDGTKIPMLVRRPAHCKAPCPIVVEFHGGPEDQAMAGFSARAQLFVDAGFTLVRPNVRGSDGYGKTWLHADDGAKRLAVITDIEDCAIYLRSAWKATKIGVTGASYGGYATLMAMTYFAGAYDAGAEQVGMSNLVTFLDNTAPYRRALRISEYGDPVKDRDVLDKLSPINYVAKASAPLLMIAGVNDPRVPVGEAIQLHDALVRRGLPDQRLMLFPDEGHGASTRANVVQAIGQTIAFFETQLLTH